MYFWHDQFSVILLRMESYFFLKLGKLVELVNQLCNSIIVISTKLFILWLYILQCRSCFASRCCINMHWKRHLMPDRCDEVDIFLLSYRANWSRNLAEGNDCSALHGWQNSQPAGWSDILFKKCFIGWTWRELFAAYYSPTGQQITLAMGTFLSKTYLNFMNCKLLCSALLDNGLR